ncbi:MAG: GNAT family protein [Dehalococcoidia bacterium]|jgi:ribosomal-protein-serine acetyltransferase|nr:GNAT family protein [Dehalococcoidia bacterium]
MSIEFSDSAVTPVLELEDSLVLRPVELDDAESYYGLLADNLDYVSDWLRRSEPPATVDERRKLMAAELESGKTGNSHWWLIESDGQLAGTIAFHNIRQRDRWTLVGYWLGERFTGRGIMTNSLRTVIDWAFTELGLIRVEIHSAIANQASCAVPERLGIRRESIRRQSETINGTTHDMAIYAAIADNWPVKPPEKPLPLQTISVDDEIRLRPVAESDQDAMWQAIDGGRAYLEEFLPWIDEYPSQDHHTAGFRKRLFERDNFDRTAAYVLEYRGRLGGMVGLGTPTGGNGIELGYWLREDLQGRGIMTRSIEAVIGMVVVHMGMHRVVIRAATGNLPSRGIPERLGFTHEGALREAAYVNGEYHDLEIYSMLDHEWLARSENA